MAGIRWFYTNKGKFKGLFFIAALLIIAAQVGYTQYIVKKLRGDQREIVATSASIYSLIAEGDVDANYTVLLDRVIQQISIPVILTTVDGEPQAHKIARIPDNTLPFPEETLRQLRQITITMDKENPPIPIEYNGTVLNLIHYGDSEMIRLLNWLPAIELAIVGLFIFLGFAGFNNIRKSEERFTWVGMAKETAHQLGTPISSLIGWIEMLKESQNPERTAEIIKEMGSDATRLTKVAQRFSQIGSNSEVADQDIVSVLSDVADYLRKRLPQSGKSVIIHEDFPEKAVSKINKDLFEWSVENLIKNGLDAIESGYGEITIHLSRHHENDNYCIDITDTGKGMTKQQQKRIFTPGFSTKKRGWGLGLNLAKRIVEDYHGGKLILKNTRLNEGTTMRIVINASS